MKRFYKRAGAMVLGALALLFVASLSFYWGAPKVDTVQAAVITPIAQTGRDGSRIATFFNSQVITVDTRVCFDLADMELLDLQYQVDAGASNQTTVTLQQTNIDPTSGPFNTAQTIATVAATPADGNAFSQVGLFGRWNCVFADLSDTDGVTLTIIGVAK